MSVRVRMKRLEDSVVPEPPPEPVARSVQVGGPAEPRRRAEWTAGIGLALFFVLLALVRLRSAPVLRVDSWISSYLHDVAVSHHWVVAAALDASLLGMTAVRWVVVGLLALVLVANRRPRAAAFVVVVELVSSGLSVIAQDVVARHRPVLADPVAVATGPSFPSGHAMGAAATYALVISAILYSGLVAPGRRRTVTVVLLVLAPVLVGASRVVLGVHFASDVLAGWVAGVAWVALATALVRPWRRDAAAQQVSEPGRQ
jgi:undecaprenyl-diphosphatase